MVSKQTLHSFYRLNNQDLADFRSKHSSGTEMEALVKGLKSAADQKMKQEQAESAKYSASKEETLLSILSPYMDEFMNPGAYRCFYFLDNPRFKGDMTLQQKMDRKLKNAINKYAGGAARERVYMVCDATVFGSAREGFLLTDEHLYFNFSKDRVKRVSVAGIQLKIARSVDRILEVEVDGRSITVDVAENHAQALRVKQMIEDFGAAVMHYSLKGE